MVFQILIEEYCLILRIVGKLPTRVNINATLKLQFNVQVN